MVEIQFNTTTDHYEARCNFRENYIIKHSSSAWKWDKVSKCWYTKLYNTAHQLIQDLEQFERNRQDEVNRLINNRVEYHVRFGEWK